MPYKHLVDRSIELAQYPPQHVAIVQRGLDPESAKHEAHAMALMGFDQSIEKALGAYDGEVSFRLVRCNGSVKAELKPVRSS